jgi:hypothetical protein
MALSYLLDENQRGVLWRAAQLHNALGVDPLDITRVGDPPDLPLGSSDVAILEWAEANDRILVSRDKKTLTMHLSQHLASGRHSPGVFVLRANSTIRAVLGFSLKPPTRALPSIGSIASNTFRN